MKVEEKILLLGSLLHDVGKFQQRCENIRRTHEVLGAEFAARFKEQFIKILGSETDYGKMVNVIKEHHNKKADELTQYCLNADHLSASEREEPDLNEKGQIIWGQRFLASVLGKAGLLNKKQNIVYYAQDILSAKNYSAIIPTITEEKEYNYPSGIFTSFTSDIEAVLNFYTDEKDFVTLVNILLKVIEKYMWCVPDFTGSSATDISLYNHLKDTAGFSHALYKSSGDELNLLIGYIPGIQNYIFNLANKKTPKMLRGRSIFVQIMSRVFASIMLKHFGLTDANLIMLAGGKFYIITPDTQDTIQKIEAGTKDIYRMLENNFDFELKYVYGIQKFNYTELRAKKISFGDIIEKASADLDANKKCVFQEYRFFNEGKINEPGFGIDFEFDEDDSAVNKDEVTGKPINKSKKSKIEGAVSSKQTKMEYKIGENIVRSNLLIEFTDDYSEIAGEPKKLDKNYKYSVNPKILLNPNLEELLNIENLKGNILRDMVFIDAASYCTLKDNQVLDFDKMAQQSSGARYLTLIKGDIDNLGLLMAYGLADDNNDLTSVSRTTTMSNNLKHLYSVFLNNFLEEWEKKNSARSVYTVFAGGDDLMVIAPQSAALELLNEFNSCFKEFVCNNPEIHVTYSLTNFHPKTPLKIVSELSEENQEAAKQAATKDINLDDARAFYPENNKAYTRLHNANIKNEQLDYIIENKKMLIQLVDGDNKFTRSVLRKLFELMEIKDYNKAEIQGTEGRWHPLLNYLVNRILKNKNNKYENKENEILFETLLKMNQKEFIMFSMTIYPLLNEVIYSIRNERN